LSHFSHPPWGTSFFLRCDQLVAGIEGALDHVAGSEVDTGMSSADLRGACLEVIDSCVAVGDISHGIHLLGATSSCSK
jgi:hypothetical protein